MKIEYHTVTAPAAPKNLLSIPEKTLVKNKITGLVYCVLPRSDNKVQLLGLSEFNFGSVLCYSKKEAKKTTAFEIFDKELRIRNS